MRSSFGMPESTSLALMSCDRAAVHDQIRAPEGLAEVLGRVRALRDTTRSSCTRSRDSNGRSSRRRAGRTRSCRSGRAPGRCRSAPGRPCRLRFRLGVIASFPYLFAVPNESAGIGLAAFERVVQVRLLVHAPPDEVEVHFRGLVRLAAEARLRALDAEQDGGACFGWNRGALQRPRQREAFACFSFIGPRKRFLFPRLSHV